MARSTRVHSQGRRRGLPLPGQLGRPASHQVGQNDPQAAGSHPSTTFPFGHCSARLYCARRSVEDSRNRNEQWLSLLSKTYQGEDAQTWEELTRIQRDQGDPTSVKNVPWALGSDCSDTPSGHFLASDAGGNFLRLSDPQYPLSDPGGEQTTFVRASVGIGHENTGKAFTPVPGNYPS